MTVAPVLSSVVSETMEDTSTDISVSLPELSDADGAATETFLDGPGAPLKVLLDVARSLSEGGSPRLTDCESALDALAAGPSPVELAELAGQVPDPVLSAAFVAVVTTTDEYITRCTTGEDPGDSRFRLQDAVVLADTRIAEL